MNRLIIRWWLTLREACFRRPRYGAEVLYAGWVSVPAAPKARRR